jgi:hypothetical protein
MIYYINKHYSGVDLAVYIAPEDQSGMYYQYSEKALGDIIDKLQQARYIQISDKYVAICHLQFAMKPKDIG